ncbi:MAG: endonuclease/exonuclease/phosphatase family protein [Albidovulum sp.]|uniref:endonuclease/exonuclease/phosphatase family protein n=1 Tax=Albidovulum sp. TaxID=1872424 RepID=UPI003CAE53E1
MRDILSGRDEQVEAAADVIAAAAPDILLVTGFDYDLDGVALAAFADRLSDRGVDYPHAFAIRPNTGWQSGVDLNGDGKLGGPGDAQGYGRFAGENGMAILSLLPIENGAALDYSTFLWRDLPEGLIAGAALSDDAQAVQRLSTTGHWSVPVILSDGSHLTLLAWYATPPVFDGSEDRNGRRNHDETAFWLRLLDGDLPFEAPSGPFVLLGDANLDPVDGDGRAEALSALLTDPRIQDVRPGSDGARAAAAQQAGVNESQSGEAATDTADWPDDRGPGNLRVDYVLPSAGLKVLDAGVWWPEPGDPALAPVEAASRHRLVWVEVEFP